MKTQRRYTVLAVDDDEINLMILVKNVQEAGYMVKSFTSGEAAWEHLINYPSDIDIALLDKMMPGTNGLDLLKLIKNDPALKPMPVILQTGDVGLHQMREGLENGAYYYLTKPFHPEILTAILHSAANECTMRQELREQMTASNARFIALMQEGEFVFRTHSEGRLLAATVSQAATYPEFVALGLTELFANAVEHGNYGIGYERKRKCLLNNSWQKELKTRAESPEYCHRLVRVRAEKTAGGLNVAIIDEGKGFDWQKHMYDDNEPSKLNEPNGRGIAKAIIMLDNVRYIGKGNEVHCTIGLPAYLSLSGDAEKKAAHG